MSKEHITFDKKTNQVSQLDNATNITGILLRPKTTDEQEVHRLAHTPYFFETAKKVVHKLEFSFNLKLEPAQDVRHNHKQMKDAAAKILFD
ncbi:hypothetical protein [Aquimarina pacifica]|uniref:hypothetical protein n=1 Tax=Aquimarina pacifica TaxID=1296415 RepID=UPI00046EAA8A|nr:hypothetical protein [Aquimarina pacifica]